MSESLFGRLGGAEGVAKLTNDIVDLHTVNESIATRFADTDIPAVKEAATAFFIAGTGGPNNYKGKDMRSVHKGMNISATEFMAVLDDALSAMAKNDVGQREQEEVLFVLYSLRSEILRV